MLCGGAVQCALLLFPQDGRSAVVVVAITIVCGGLSLIIDEGGEG